MFGTLKLHKNEKGQAALETAIILIAFVVVASVFAFAILSAGSASTERGEQAIYSGLQGVQSSMEIKGAVVAEADDPATPTAVDNLIFTVSLVAGGEPLNLNDVVVSYRDAGQRVGELTNNSWTATVGDTDDLLEENEMIEITVGLAQVTTPALAANTPFTVEVKPPTGGVLQINRTTPAALEGFMELR